MSPYRPWMMLKCPIEYCATIWKLFKVSYQCWSLTDSHKQFFCYDTPSVFSFQNNKGPHRRRSEERKKNTDVRPPDCSSRLMALTRFWEILQFYCNTSPHRTKADRFRCLHKPPTWSPCSSIKLRPIVRPFAAVWKCVENHRLRPRSTPWRARSIKR